MKKKKISLLILIILIIITITSCDNTTPGLQTQPGSREDDISSSQIQSQLSSELSKPDISGKGDLWADKKLTIGVLGPGAESSWRTTLIKDIMDAAEEWNIELKFFDGQGKDELQIEHLEKLIEKKVDVIGFMPVVMSGWDEILAKVKEAGIPLIFLDKYADCSDKSLWTSHIVNDWEKEGQMAGEWLIDYLQKQERMNEKIRIAEIKGTDDAEAAINRGQGFKEVIKENLNMEIIISKKGDFTQAKGYKIMQEILSEMTDINVVFCHNDDMALGVIEAIEEAGLVPGEDILIISVEGTKKALEEVVHGKIACTVEDNPLMGDLFMEACVRLANGEEIEREIHPVDRVFDITNAQAELDARKENGYGY